MKRELSPAQAGVSATASKPWLQLYGQLPSEITPPWQDGLHMFLAAVELAPSAPLIHFDGRSFARCEVDELSDALAAALAASGVRSRDRIALYLQNVPQFVIAVLSAWKIGATVVPCNPMLKSRELTHVFQDSTPKALISDRSLYHANAEDVLAEAGVDVVITTSERDLISRSTPANNRGTTNDLVELIDQFSGATIPEPSLAPDDIAFLVYTSGTTGPSKGAMNLHRNVVYTSCVFREWLGLDERDVIYGLAPLFHITGLVAHLGLSFATGAPLVLTPRFSAPDALRLIERHQVTFTIGAITGFIAMLGDETFGTRDLTAFTKVYSGGAPVPEAVINEWKARTGVYIRNGYGLTEATTATNLVPMHLEAPVDAASKAVSIGLPVFGTEVKVLDEAGQELPPNEIGEITIRGPGLVPGYWNNPGETERAFSSGAFRTGDVGFMDSDGWFYVVDRRKDMIVASGFKVWPREVEDVLFEHTAVKEAAVVGVPDPYRGETVRAFVVVREGLSVTAAELIEFCRSRMAAYKYPREIVFVDELPKTPTGKVLRRELRMQEQLGSP